MRAAQPADAEAIAAVMAGIAEEDVIATEAPVDVAARARAFRATIDRGGLPALWVLEHDDEVVGYAGVHESGVAGVLALGIGIQAGSRGRGGGRALLRAIVAHAHAHGVHKLELEVWPENARAVALYASEGFAVEGLRREHYLRRDGSRRSALLMARLLGG